MVLIKRHSAVPIRFGGEEHSGWLPANAAKPLPTPVEEALVDFEIREVEGGYLLQWYSQNTGHRGDLWYETLQGALEQASNEWDIEPEEWQAANSDA